MSRELFIKTINYMQSLNDKGTIFNEVLKKLDPESYVFCNIYGDVIDYLYEMLEELTEDTCDEISYYLWELDYGRDYKDGCIIDDKGNNIRMSTPEELWDIIQNDKKI